jgi:hypothetical protein
MSPSKYLDFQDETPEVCGLSQMRRFKSSPEGFQSVNKIQSHNVQAECEHDFLEDQQAGELNG